MQVQDGPPYDTKPEQAPYPEGLVENVENVICDFYSDLLGHIHSSPCHLPIGYVVPVLLPSEADVPSIQ